MSMYCAEGYDFGRILNTQVVSTQLWILYKTTCILHRVFLHTNLLATQRNLSRRYFEHIVYMLRVHWPRTPEPYTVYLQQNVQRNESDATYYALRGEGPCIS